CGGSTVWARRPCRSKRDVCFPFNFRRAWPQVDRRGFCSESTSFVTKYITAPSFQGPATLLIKRLFIGGRYNGGLVHCQVVTCPIRPCPIPFPLTRMAPSSRACLPNAS